MLVDNVDVTPYIYYVPGEGWPRIKDDAPQWVHDYYDKLKATQTVAWDSPIKVE